MKIKGSLVVDDERLCCEFIDLKFIIFSESLLMDRTSLQLLIEKLKMVVKFECSLPENS